MSKFAKKGEAHVLMEKWDRSVLDINTMLSLRWEWNAKIWHSATQDIANFGRLQEVRKWWNLLRKLLGVMSLGYCGLLDYIMVCFGVFKGVFSGTAVLSKGLSIQTAHTYSNSEAK